MLKISNLLKNIFLLQKAFFAIVKSLKSNAKLKVAKKNKFKNAVPAKQILKNLRK